MIGQVSTFRALAGYTAKAGHRNLEDGCGPGTSKADETWRGISVRLGALIAAALILAASAANAEDEVSLFDGSGKAVAYVAPADDLTIYLWGGKPVAYLVSDVSGGFQVYGFNGRHLGWFVHGVVWNHDGSASCAAKEAAQLPQLESLKSLKELKPIKGLKELAPLRPLFSNSFGGTPCEFLLAQGAE